MLQEGLQAKAEGRDVVIGYLEPHDRPETTALAEGLESVPRLRVAHGSLELEEMDVNAVIRRAPELALVDELAHTNAVGSRNEKRYQDIEEILAAGIDVISTVNIQHLESLNDAVFELTGVRVR
jgi:two-component system sensor histidine kinase KdpD